MALSCSSVCVCKRIVRTGQILAKIKNVKNDVYRFLHLQSACDIDSVVLHDFDQLFQGQIFQNQYLENGESWRKTARDNICRFQYLLSNDIIANVILFDHYRFFHGKIFQMSISRKQ